FVKQYQNEPTDSSGKAVGVLEIPCLNLCASENVNLFTRFPGRVVQKMDSE
ncbi:hypothetical protein Godav_022172, partial [Gossypium davidsonii]|nr:hypothetical protein [Gossypium davidsonii]